MNINSKDNMFGLPILLVREVLRQAVKGRLWGNSRDEVISKVAQILKQSTATAQKLIKSLLKEKYIAWEKENFPEYVQYEIKETDKGRRCSMAKATAPITRTKATRLLNDLI